MKLKETSFVQQSLSFQVISTKTSTSKQPKVLDKIQQRAQLSDNISQDADISVGEKLKADVKPTQPIIFKQKWVQQFTWANYEYQYDDNTKTFEEIMYCTICREYLQILEKKIQSQEIISLPKFPKIAKGTTNVKIDTLNEHAEAKCSFHQNALDYKLGINASSDDIEKEREQKEKQLSYEGNRALLLSGRSKQQFSLLEAHFKNAFFICEKNLSLENFDDLQQLALEHGVLLNENYQSVPSGNEFISYLCEVVLENLLGEIKNNKFLSISIDSQQTLAKKEIICFCIKYFDKDFDLQERFLGIREMESAQAVKYFQYTFQLLQKYELTKNLYFLATDGAPVMLANNGLAGKLKQQIPYLISIHCKAHKAALGIKELSEQFSIIKDLNFLVYHIVSIFNTSKKQKIFEDAQINLRDIDYDETLNLIQPFDVRWVSYFPAIERIIKQLLPLLSALQEIVKLDYNPNTNYYFNLIKNIDNIINLAHYADMLHPVYKLTKVLQRAEFTIDSFQLELSTCQNQLKLLSDLQNPYEGPLIQHIRQNINRKNQISLYENKFELTAQGSFDMHFKKIYNKFSQISQQLNQNLTNRFEEIDYIKKFRALCLDTIKLNKADRNFGIQEIKEILNFYSSQDNEIFSRTEIDEVIEQYKQLKLQLYGEFKVTKYQDLIKILSNTESYNKIVDLFKLYQIIPVTSVECERVFSQVGLIITKRRQRLSIQHLNQLLMVSRNGGKRSQFNYQQAFSYWKSAKMRRFI